MKTSRPKPTCTVLAEAIPPTRLRLDSHAGVSAIRRKAACFFVDPPYNIGVDYEVANDAMSIHEYEDFTDAWIRLAGRVVRNTTPEHLGGSLFALLPDSQVAMVKTKLDEAGWTFQNWIIWHYRFGNHCHARFLPCKAHLLYYTREDKGTWNEREVLEPSIRAKMGDKRVADSPNGDKRVMTDVWFGPELGRVQGNNRERRKIANGAIADHRNQVPELLLARCIRATTNPGDLVVDPCVGSGTTPTVAIALKRNFFGFEINPKYAASALHRVEQGPICKVDGPLYRETAGYNEPEE